MIKDYIMASDNNKREIFRVFHVDTTAIYEYCHNNFLPVRYQAPAFTKNYWIDIVEDTENHSVVLYLRVATTDGSSIVEISIDDDTICLNPSIKPLIKKKQGRFSVAYRVNSYSGDSLLNILEKINLNMDKKSGLRTLGPIPKDTLLTRKISGVPVERERYASRFYEFDWNEKLGIKNSLELYRDLRRKYKL
jgi:hypothetical protein